MLVVDDLHYGPVVGASFTLGPGLTVLTGEPECGTSTLLRLVAGLQKPESGTVTGPPRAYLSTPPGTEWSKHDKALDALDAPHLIGREMWTLSGGERQRVRIAHLLNAIAPILLVDEPLGLLDGRGVALIIDRLLAVNKPVLAVCKSDPSLAEAAHQVLVMENGAVHVG